MAKRKPRSALVKRAVKIMDRSWRIDRIAIPISRAKQIVRERSE